MKNLFLVLSAAFIVGCGGGPSSAELVNVRLPSFSHIESDFAGRALAGTADDPIIIGEQVFAKDMLGIAGFGEGTKLVWPQANYYNTTLPHFPKWILSVNNEPAQYSEFNTGAPNRSEEIGGKHFHLGHSDLYAGLSIDQVEYNNNGYIPYMGLATTAVAGNYGDDTTVLFDADIEWSKVHHNFAYFIVCFEMPDGKRYMPYLHLMDSLGHRPGVKAVDWAWRYRGSYHYPGASIKFISTKAFNDNTENKIPEVLTDGSYQYKINLDELMRIGFPEMDLTNAKILYIEFSIEQGPYDNVNNLQMHVDMDIRNVSATKKMVFSRRPGSRVTR